MGVQFAEVQSTEGFGVGWDWAGVLIGADVRSVCGGARCWGRGQVSSGQGGTFGCPIWLLCLRASFWVGQARFRGNPGFRGSQASGKAA